jgi:hypothetical protein
VDAELFEVYDFIESYKAKHGYSPSLDDIADALGVTKGMVYHQMETMENLGMIVQPRGLLKAIKLISRQPNPSALTKSTAQSQTAT